MKFDLFFSLCQTAVDGYLPSERQMFINLFDQVRHADKLGFSCAWLGESHLSTSIQQGNPNPVVPEFQGEISLNTDTFQMGHRIFAMTERLEVGIAVLNILCNGGPIARAEQVKTFLTLHGLDPTEKRKLHVGFGRGRFPFSNRPYGTEARNALERACWPALRGKLLAEATEIFLRFLRGDAFSSRDVAQKHLKRQDFCNEQDWQLLLKLYGEHVDQVGFPPFWTFEKTGVIPNEARLDLLELIIGTHEPENQVLANQFMPCGVFNLSITPNLEIEDTHRRMQHAYHPSGGGWQREYLPRTVMVFIDNSPGISDAERNRRAQEKAEAAMQSFWKAMSKTVDPERMKNAVKNQLVGSPESIRDQIHESFHPQDRLMTWFDYHNHDPASVKQNMSWFMEEVVPYFA